MTHPENQFQIPGWYLDDDGQYYRISTAWTMLWEYNGMTTGAYRVDPSAAVKEMVEAANKANRPMIRAEHRPGVPSSIGRNEPLHPTHSNRPCGRRHLAQRSHPR